MKKEKTVRKLQLGPKQRTELHRQIASVALPGIATEYLQKIRPTALPFLVLFGFRYNHNNSNSNV